MDFKGLILALIVIMSFSFVFATPTGPNNINITANETNAGSSTGSMVNVTGGNITTMNISTSVQNDNWKAFVGWISGSYTLDDSSSSTIYDWSLASVSGEVYATRESGSVSWTTVNCANQTHIETEDSSLDHTGEDNITSTFGDTNTDTFVVAGTQISSGNCSSTYTYVDNSSQSSDFEEMILYDYTGADLIFATKIYENSSGFDENYYDFQMIVPENANETFTSATAYYLYVELG